jgi:putative flippase GtrA
MKIKKKTQKIIVQFVEYMFTGGVWFWSGYILIVVLDNHIGLFWANLVGNTIGISLNFLLNRLWVFKTKKPEKLQDTAGRYIVYTVLNAFILNYLILSGLQTYAGLGPEIGQFIASGFFTVWNYFWYKTWVFKGKERPRRLKGNKAVVKKSTQKRRR